MTRFKAQEYIEKNNMEFYNMTFHETGLVEISYDDLTDLMECYAESSVNKIKIGGEWYTVEELRIKVEDFYPFLEQRVESLQVNNAQLKADNTTLKRENLQLREAEDFTEEELKSIPTNELEAEVVLLKAEVERLKEVIRILDTAIEKAVDIKHDHKSAYDIMCEVYKYIESGRNQAIKIIENQ